MTTILKSDKMTKVTTCIFIIQPFGPSVPPAIVSLPPGQRRFFSLVCRRIRLPVCFFFCFVHEFSFELEFRIFIRRGPPPRPLARFYRSTNSAASLETFSLRLVKLTSGLGPPAFFRPKTAGEDGTAPCRLKPGVLAARPVPGWPGFALLLNSGVLAFKTSACG